MKIKANDDTQLTQTDSRVIVVDMGFWYFLGSVITATWLITGIGLIVYYVHKHNDKLQYGPKNAEGRALCPNGNVEDCPEHLKILLAALEVCRGVDEEDLAQRLLRKNADLAILRETVINRAGGNLSITNYRGTNTIM